MTAREGVSEGLGSRSRALASIDGEAGLRGRGGEGRGPAAQRAGPAAGEPSSCLPEQSASWCAACWGQSLVPKRERFSSLMFSQEIKPEVEKPESILSKMRSEWRCWLPSRRGESGIPRDESEKEAT